MNIKVRLIQLGKKQVDLLAELQKRGFPKLSPSLLSNYINGRDRTPQRNSVLDMADRILSEWESEA